MWLRIEVVYQCPELAAESISLHGVSDLSADRVGHIDADCCPSDSLRN